MRSGRFARHKGLRSLGITLLILGLVPVPLPQVDYHNVRHHDRLGEVCEFHDHLLVWHPDSGLSEDVAVWHCHWFPAGLNFTDMDPAGDGPAARAHIPDPSPVACCDAPRVASAAGSVSVSLFATWPPATLMTRPSFDDFAPSPTASPPEAPSPTPHVSLTLLLRRLAC